MSWQCPQCNSVNDESLTRCVCGYEDSTEEIIDEKEEARKKIKSAIIVLLLWGLFNVVVGYMFNTPIKDALLRRFTEIKPLMWVALYGSVVLGILQLSLGFVGLLLRKPIVLLFSGAMFFVLGCWNIGSDFLAIPALAQYDIPITASSIWEQKSFFWILIAFIQSYWGYRHLDAFKKLRR